MDGRGFEGYAFSMTETQTQQVNSPRSMEWFDIDETWQHRLTGCTSHIVEYYLTAEQAKSEVATYREYGDRTNFYTLTPIQGFDDNDDPAVRWELSLVRPASN
jgi:hypothetical protein